MGEIHLYLICWFKFQLKELDVKGFDIFKASQTVSFDQPGNIFSKGTRFKLSILQNCCYCYCFHCCCCFAALPVTTCALILCTFPYVAGRLKIQLAPSSSYIVLSRNSSGFCYLALSVVFPLNQE